MTILRTNTIAGTGTTFGPLLDGNLEFNSQNYVVLPKGTSTQEGVLRTTADVVGTGGTFYDNLVLAMPFNAATGLTDVSSRNRNPAAYGNTTISTAQSKYYGSSAYFDGSGDYLSLVSSNDFKFGTGDFTVEAWIYQTADNTYPTLFEIGNHLNSSGIVFITRSGGNAQIYSGGFYGAVSFSLNQWNHLAFVRSSGNLLIFVNGVLGSTTAFTNNLTDTSFIVSGVSLSPVSTSVYWFNGYLQDLRIYKGLAKYTSNFTPPDRIAEVGVGFKTGQLRYNTDSNKVELYDGNQWTEVQSSRPDLNGGARGIFGGGYTAPGNTNVIQYITISSTGNSLDFGDLTVPRRGVAGCSSNTRGIFGGGTGGTPDSIKNTLDYITISSTGDSISFGSLSVTRRNTASCSNATRGIWAGGNDDSTYYNTIDYVTISSIGNAVDFGDLTSGRTAPYGLSSATRGIFGGGFGNPANTNIIDYITISTLGNATDFGDLTIAARDRGSCSNSIRGLFASYFNVPSTTGNIIDYITIATLGNAVKFGELSATRYNPAGCASPTRGVFASGAGLTNTIDYVTIMTQGNAVDFGDTLAVNEQLAGVSNAHGGL
jgi:hypothetical protein